MLEPKRAASSTVRISLQSRCSLLQLIGIQLAVFCVMAEAPAPAAEIGEPAMTLRLNWAPGADHAPFYYAQQQGWYRTAGIRLAIEPGAGSTDTLQKVANSPNTVGIADFTQILIARSKSADVVAIMNIFTNSPHTLYWRKSSGITSLREFSGRRLGTPINDPIRILWRALAKVNAVDSESVVWVDIGHNAKLGALKDERIDVAVSSFFYNHRDYVQAFGQDLVELRWADAGLNLYSNSLVANRDMIERAPHVLRSFVSITQRAFTKCLTDPMPCLDALVQANSQLDRAEQAENWGLVRSLIAPKSPPGAALGAFDAQRIKLDYAVISEAFKLDRSVDSAAAVTHEFLDSAIRVNDEE